MDTKNIEPMTEGELKYYGSPLNKFIAENCRKDMTVINADLITYSYKDKHIRFIESKHDFEKMGTGQRLLLQLMRKLFKQITGYTVDVLIIRGNPPYERVTLEDPLTGKKKCINQKQLIDFLNYK